MHDLCHEIVFSHGHGTNLYPTPCTVLMCSGCEESRSSFARSPATWLSTVRLEGYDSYPHTSFNRSSRVTTWPAREARNRSTANSLRVISTGSPFERAS